MIQHGYSTASGKTVIDIKDSSLQLNSNNQHPEQITLNDNELEELLGVPSVDQVNESMRITLNHRQELPSNPDIEENADRELIEMGIPSLDECRRQINLGLTLNTQKKETAKIDQDLQENSDGLADLGIPSVQEARRQMNLVNN